MSLSLREITKLLASWRKLAHWGRWYSFNESQAAPPSESIQANSTLEQVFQKYFQTIKEEIYTALCMVRFLGICSRGMIGFRLGAQAGYSLSPKNPLGNHIMPQGFSGFRIHVGTRTLNTALPATEEGFLLYWYYFNSMETNNFIGVSSGSILWLIFQSGLCPINSPFQLEVAEKEIVGTNQIQDLPRE